MAVEQSGDITPGHGVKWITDNVVGDSGALPSAQRVLATLANADFNITTDQPIQIPQAITQFWLTGILITAPTLSLTTAAGGFYTEEDKGGNALVAAGQVYSFLTTSNLILQATLTTYAQQRLLTRTNLPDWAIYFSLTTAQGASSNANLYVIGMDLSLGSEEP